MEAATRAEPGCQTYAFSLDICEPTTMRITERWESMADIEKHMKTSHMAEFVKAVGAIQPKSMDIKVYEIANNRNPARGPADAKIKVYEFSDFQ